MRAPKSRRKQQEERRLCGNVVMLLTALIVVGICSFALLQASLMGNRLLRERSHTERTMSMPVASNIHPRAIALSPSALLSSSPPLTTLTQQYPTTKRVFNSAIEEAINILQQHPLKQLPTETVKTMPMEDVVYYIQHQSMCIGKPVIISMAQVGTELYWQLVENFIYTMVKFRLSDCALMICVTDPACMELCAASDFPCIYYGHDQHNPGKDLPSALEQIANLKLLHLPRALRKGVDLLMLDLDVGFLADPIKMIGSFYTDKMLLQKDVIVQQDMVFIMDRSVEKWKTWYVYPMPNIGLFLVRGTNKTADMFEVAWRDYQTMTPARRALPGKDQNKVVEAMKSVGLKWYYWPRKQAPLLDKVFKFENKTYELGGEAAHRWFHPNNAVAVHTTCYEQRTKMMGLKASNAFWNPYYYDPQRPTLTKVLLWTGDEVLFRNELQSLVYLSIVTGRSLIVPNVLGPDNTTAVDLYADRAFWPGFRVLRKRPEGKDPSMSSWMGEYQQHHTSKRVADTSALSVLEPGFYWRVVRDYASAVPDPYVVGFTAGDSMRDMEERLLRSDVASQPRVVIDVVDGVRDGGGGGGVGGGGDRGGDGGGSGGGGAGDHTERHQRLRTWARDSVGMLRPYREEIVEYALMPVLDASPRASLQGGWSGSGSGSGAGVGWVGNGPLARSVVGDIRPCRGLFETYTMRGNRSCFDRCR